MQKKVLLFFLFCVVFGSISQVSSINTQYQIEYLEGIFQHVHADNFEQQTSTDSYYLLTPNAQLTKLIFPDDLPKISSGTHLSIQGYRQGSDFIVTSLDVVSLPTSSPLATQTKKVAVILFNFNDDLSEPITLQRMRDVVFLDPSNESSIGSPNIYYQEISFDQLHLEGNTNPEGDIYGWFTLNYSKTVCDAGNWAYEAKIQAETQGFNFSDYTNVIYAFPQTTSCSWGGLAILGGVESWINGLNRGWSNSVDKRVISHELGHNFGAHHASGYFCYDALNQPVTISDNCMISEYGDLYDVMGTPYRHMNNYHKGKLGWFTPSNLLDVSSEGLYTLTPIETSSSGTQALRVPRRYDTSGSVIEYYYLEYRKSYNNFDWFSALDPAVNGITIRLAPDYPVISRSFLLDMNPTTQRDANGFLDYPLILGKTFYDDLQDIIISVVDLVPGQYATVNVSFHCNLTAPSLSISPINQVGLPGETLYYNLTLTNNERPICGDRTFMIDPLLPSELTQAPSLVTVTAPAGQSRTEIVGISSSPASTLGTKPFNEKAWNIASPTLTTTTTAYYTVISPPDLTPPTITITNPQDNAILPKKGNVQVSATADDHSGINNIKIYIDTILKKTCTYTTACQYNWNMNSVSRGQHNITVTAQDSSPNLNFGSASIVVTKP